MEKVIVDSEKCIGCGLCVSMSPENFDFDDNGYSKVINDEVTEEANDAKDMCPVNAIEIK